MSEDIERDGYIVKIDGTVVSLGRDVTGEWRGDILWLKSPHADGPLGVYDESTFMGRGIGIVRQLPIFERLLSGEASIDLAMEAGRPSQ